MKKELIVEVIEELFEMQYVKKEPALQQALADLRTTIVKDYYTVAVLGEFKHGKSSFINSLLGKELLLTDVLPETATINMVFYNDEPMLQVVYKDGHVENGEISSSYLKQFSAKNDSDINVENVDYIKIGYPLDVLKKRVLLVDTPGVADLDEVRADVTYGFLPRANAVILVLDANTPLTKTEKEFVEDRLVPLGINDILFLVNKIDCIDDEEDENFLDDLELRLKTVFKMYTKEAKLKSFSLLPFSAKMALEGTKKGDSKLLTSSGIKEVQDKLYDMIYHGSMERNKIQVYKKRLQWLLKSLERKIQTEKSMKTADINELEEAAQALRQMISEKSAQDSNVDKYIDSAKSKIFAMTDKSLKHFHVRLKEHIFDLIEEYKNQDFKKFVEKVIPKQIQNNIESWIVTYIPHIDDLLGMMERELARGLSQQFKQNIRLQAKRDGKIQSSPVLFNIDAVDISDTQTKANAITAAGAVVLAMINPLMTPILSFWGRNKIFNNILEKKLAEAKADLLPQMESQLATAILGLRSEVHKYIDKQGECIQKNTQSAFDSLLTNIKERLEAQIVAKKQVGDNIQKEMDELTMQEREINDLLKILEG